MEQNNNNNNVGQKRPRNDPVEVRIAAMNTKMDLELNVTTSLAIIRNLIQECAAQVAETVRNEANGGYDMGRLIHAMDLLQQAKDTASMALILPRVAEQRPEGNAEITQYMVKK